ncbi:sugar transporter [Grosmannia clavigera kw1407]|uniref:Sugar transporter n=1 Tax=Grosmannia clavigera (strain kw1407 / UAMH 11150) TaxID=655863 RepID=F0XCR2_GROCL|nr:sugar transporter [Grosmannia clavigera kw1407]EFX04075.1 sugar transporter [Grosmannia clavigera kw1407]
MLRPTWLSFARREVSIEDYPGTLVPLEEAHLYSHSARTGRTEYETLAEDDVDEDEEALDQRGKDTIDGDGDVEAESVGMLLMRACEYSIEGLRREVRSSPKDSPGSQTTWTDYELKSKLINKAIQDIGMGRYNWELFCLCGFGWFADNLWMQGISLILPSLSAEFGIGEKTVRYTTSALFLGLCFGSFFWGIGSDVLGRRLAFNCTLLITSIFGTAAAYAPSWGSVCALVAALGFGVGGNLPVDGALFLEFLPDASSSLLTLLSVWWPMGQLCSSLLAWMQIADVSSGTSSGWRRFVTTIGLLTFAMFLIRFFVFRLFESPKFLLSQDRQAEAVAVIHGLAHRNGTKTWLTGDILDAVAHGGNNGTSIGSGWRDGPGYQAAGYEAAPGVPLNRQATASSATGRPATTMLDLVHSRLKSFSGERLRPLFQSRQLGMATVIIWIVWATIGMGYPLFNAFLPQYLSHGDSSAEAPSDAAAQTLTSSTTYRNYAITSIVGVPGSLLAAYTVDSPSRFLGRRGTLAISTLVSAVFLFVFVTFGHSSRSQLVFSCIEAFSQNIMYGVLYAFTPEIFPAPVRGAGTGVASFLNRITGLVAPVLAATLPGDGSTAPIYLSAALILLAFVGMVLIPIETRGRQRL